MAIILPTIENLSSRDVKDTDLTQFNHPGYPNVAKSKWREKCSQPDFKHAFYSGVFGEMADIRVGPDNPAVLLNAIVADFDDKISEEQWEMMEARWNPKYPPNIFTSTNSGGVRLIWLLEKPLIINSEGHYKKIMKELVKLTFADRCFPCLDDAIYKSNMYYEIGINWIEIHDKKIPSSILDVIAYRLLSSKDFEDETYAIPFEDLEKEMNKRWPARWKGDFKLGSRGCRFWDNNTWDQSSSSDPHTAVLVMEGGCYNFSTMNGKPGFNSWLDIFGPKFCDEYALEKVGNAVKNWFYDGMSYHNLTEDGSRVQSFNVTSVQRMLRESGLNNKIPKGEDLSELEKAMNMIEKAKYVDGVGPFVNRHDTVIDIHRKTFLNTSRSKPMEFMSESFGIADVKKAKLHYDFLLTVFGEKQTKFLLSYMHDAYKTHYEGRPAPGQVLVIVGPPSCGKTFFVQCIMGVLMGSYQDAATYILGGSTYNQNLLESAVWYLDDEEGKSDYRARTKVTSTLKKLAANGTVRFEEKFKKGFDLPWGGRIIVLMNDDPESKLALPDLGLSNADKLIMLKCTGTYNFVEGFQAKFAKELPYFANALYNYSIPKECEGNHRYAVKPYVHPDLKEDTKYNSDVNGLMEIIELWKNRHCGKMDEWSGSTTQLLSSLLEDEEISKMMSTAKYTNVTLGRKLNSAITQGYKDIKIRKKNGIREYIIKTI